MTHPARVRREQRGRVRPWAAGIKLLGLCAGLLFSASDARAQVGQNPEVDVMGIVGNKIVWGENRLRFSGEYQARFDDFLRAFNSWMLEGKAVYMPISFMDLEFIYRFTMKPTWAEHRLAVGPNFKFIVGRTQLVLQNSYMFEPSHSGTMHHAGRHLFAANYLLRKSDRSALIGGLAGVQYGTIKGVFSGLEFIRVAVSLAVRTDDKFTMAFAMVGGYGLENDEILLAPMVQLIWTLHKEFKYIPALYVDF